MRDVDCVFPFKYSYLNREYLQRIHVIEKNLFRSLLSYRHYVKFVNLYLFYIMANLSNRAD
ncbi:hypothetical protein BpHYR1_046222 [Brachionus plicatilis]|uniref:Uncharacterized protein n=1 Tax=Brachionus plicatilis TaxID=10195 RepID=A0A3M7SNA9_BRAPC|nr:hypothetical protein BpHYR1_046222 [Brachionus plicatilis]